MFRIFKSIKNKRGMATLAVVFLVVFAMLTMGFLLVSASGVNERIASNKYHKQRTYYAADGIMTMLAEDIIDSAYQKYLSVNSKIPPNNFTGASVGIASPGPYGAYFYDGINSIHEVRAQGSGISSTSDQFHFAYFQVSGDIEFTAQLQDSIVPVDPLNAAAKAGLMIRASLDPASPYADISYGADHNVTFWSRQLSGTLAVSPTVPGPLPSNKSPLLKISRDTTSNVITGSFSDNNGATWTTMGSRTVSMTGPVYIGFAVTSALSTKLAMAQFKYSRFGTGVDSVHFNPVKIAYTLSDLGDDNFLVIDTAYEGTAANKKYATVLTQRLSRARASFIELPHQDTMYVPVTFYDYHTNSNNPVCPPWPSPYRYPNRNLYFEAQNCCDGGGLTLHMVQDTLTADRKPILKMPTAHGDEQINNWYRPSGNPPSSVAFDPTTGKWSGLFPYLRDTANDTLERFLPAGENWMYTHSTTYPNMNNVVIYDSLAFKALVSEPGTFYYQMDGQPDLNTGAQTPPFTPLDSQGFGPELHDALYSIFDIPDPGFYGGLHNYPANFSFTMEMHTQFTYVMGQNQKYVFSGDDDVWVFVNGKLAIDLGGMHGIESDSFFLDIIAVSHNLQNNHRYWLDLFYAERQSNGSDLRITTNLFQLAPPRTAQRSWRRDYGNTD
ncbi:MAG: fibro-slime domain-containing protein [Chitinivibrionales bacterium]|nr:fibro-slime domain-containing protein [Chitinivibrionales bacterium]